MPNARLDADLQNIADPKARELIQASRNLRRRRQQAHGAGAANQDLDTRTRAAISNMERVTSAVEK